MTLLTFGLYLPLWFCYGLAQSSFLDSFISFPGKDIVNTSPYLCVFVCVSLCMCVCTLLHIQHYACTTDAEVLGQLGCESMSSFWIHFELIVFIKYTCFYFSRRP